MARNFTPEQDRAIHASGHNILVAASAGSGKTTVLIERLIQKILAGDSIDQFLIVTFTNAAAAEMKERLEKALQAQIADAQPEQRQHLYQQLSLLPVAQISTIDAFALNLIEQYYYKIGLDPAFRLLSDTAEREMLRQDVLNELMGEYYATDHPDHDAFMALLANFADPNHDDGLKDKILRLADFASARPNGETWLKNLAAEQVTSGDLTGTPLFKKEIWPDFRAEIARVLNEIDALLPAVADVEELPKAAEALAEMQTYLWDLQAASDQSWDELQALFLKWPKLSIDRNTKKIKENPDLVLLLDEVRRIKQTYFDSKADLKNMADQYFSLNQEQWALVNKASQSLVKSLTDLTVAFQEAFTARKRQDNLLDFPDLEVLSREILADEETRKIIVQQFKEVLIDEYQDINLLQESLLNELSNGHNLYMVGDVKQSIYGFRQADPSLFSGKYHRYGQADNDDELIELADNFRSQANVAKLTNLIFTQIMDEKLGDVAYQDQARLVARAAYPDSLPAVFKLDLLESKKSSAEDDEGIDWEKRDAQYTRLVQRIRKLRAEGQVDAGAEGMRPVRYSDIAILTRSKGGYIDMVRLFHDADIPVQVDGVGDYFQTMEIYLMMDLLKIIDNPHQDIPLAAVLRSPMFGYGENELAKIRLADKDQDFWTALQAYAKGDEKTQDFLANYAKWAVLARQNDLVALIRAIYADTAWVDYTASLAGGAQRSANLEALYQYAASYQENVHAGLYRFIRYVEELQKSGGEIGEVSQESEEEAVRIMTIHASKGLEFPIVFLPEFEKSFNTSDTSGALLLQKDAGIGIDYLEPKSQVRLPSLAKLVVKAAIKKQSWSEEMRLLYVALTRAKQQLYVLATVKVNDDGLDSHLEELWRSARQTSEQFFSSNLRLKARSYLDWLIMSLARTNNQELIAWFGEVEQPRLLGAQSPQDAEVEFFDIAESDIQPIVARINADQSSSASAEQGKTINWLDVEKSLTYTYPNQVATQTPAYQSVSEIKRLFEDPDRAQMPSLEIGEDGRMKSEEILPLEKMALPEFLTDGSHKPSQSAVGTATHLILQLVDFAHFYTLRELEELRDELVAQERIIPAVAQLINLDDILNFLNSDFGQELARHQNSLQREATFAMLIPANQIYAKLDDKQPVLIHGIIDGYFLDPSKKELTLFDYKTDYIRRNHLSEDLKKLKHRYQGQIALYKQALSQEYPDYHFKAVRLVALSVGQLVNMD
ncbi:helicase-exonuclease AddAB subunit AddA [Eupransor demetentiae]|uniref:ATP-dependent helicase/nuclease subunit A n=1 Tax=Eupransor demetentiae TaxID=3109584 RepID=A0ABM9N3D6_9LACO|nr:3<92>-5<92> helicase subunit RecB of the DNA repair enzyme RecBCD (exonuclease V) (RecB) [Lactobacillaceae bacterium LMG 33000]